MWHREKKNIPNGGTSEKAHVLDFFQVPQPFFCKAAMSVRQHRQGQKLRSTAESDIGETEDPSTTSSELSPVSGM